MDKKDAAADSIDTREEFIAFSAKGYGLYLRILLLI